MDITRSGIFWYDCIEVRSSDWEELLSECKPNIADKTWCFWETKRDKTVFGRITTYARVHQNDRNIWYVVRTLNSSYDVSPVQRVTKSSSTGCKLDETKRNRLKCHASDGFRRHRLSIMWKKKLFFLFSMDRFRRNRTGPIEMLTLQRITKDRHYYRFRPGLISATVVGHGAAAVYILWFPIQSMISREDSNECRRPSHRYSTALERTLAKQGENPAVVRKKKRKDKPFLRFWTELQCEYNVFSEFYFQPKTC